MNKVTIESGTCKAISVRSCNGEIIYTAHLQLNNSVRVSMKVNVEPEEVLKAMKSKDFSAFDTMCAVLKTSTACIVAPIYWDEDRWCFCNNMNFKTQLAELSDYKLPDRFSYNI